MEHVLEVKNLKKAYGRLIAVNDLSFRVKKGQVFGLLGPNGSGKTTLLGCLIGILNADSGGFSWFDSDRFDDARKRIGSLIETPNFFPYLSAIENLKITAAVKGCSEDRIDIVLKETGLYDRRNDAFKGFSLGMKQRLAIAGALLSDPEVLILDEPTNGLDPQGINEIRELILRQQQAGKTIILASHLLNEVEKVCNDVVILRKGKMMMQGQVSDLLHGKLRVAIGCSRLEELRVLLSSKPVVLSVEQKNDLLIAELAEHTELGKLNHDLVMSGLLIDHFALVKSNLESEFLKLVQE